MNPPLVSILIPCYNAERWIEKAVTSALEQSWGNCEVIVVDDGSTDGSLEILAEFGERITVESYPNRGPNTTRNRLLEIAQGEWVQYLDADDYLLPDKVEHQLNTMERSMVESPHSPVDVIYSPVLVEQWEDGKPLPHVPSRIQLDKDIYCQWFAWELPQTGGPLWRRESMIAAGGWIEAPPGEVPCCEHDLYARALRKQMRFLYSPEPGAVYRIWSETTLCRQSPVKIIETKNKLFDVMIAWLKEQGSWNESHRRAAGEACFRMARSFATFDLEGAKFYFRKRQQENLIQPTGVAAPIVYRRVLRILGFAWAERLAKFQRHLRSRIFDAK